MLRSRITRSASLPTSMEPVKRVHLFLPVVTDIEIGQRAGCELRLEVAYFAVHHGHQHHRVGHI